MSHYEIWALYGGLTPELVCKTETVFQAALRLASLRTANESADFWVMRPDRMTGDNHEGIDLSDALVLQSVEKLVASRRKRLFRHTGGPIQIACKASELSELLRLSVEVGWANNLPSRAELELVHRRLNWLLKYPHVLRAAQGAP